MKHGTVDGYTNKRCRCPLCGAAMLAYKMERYHRHRKAALEQLGNKCARCEATDRLQFDHIDPTTKEMEPGAALRARAEKREAELAKCQLLCISCHSKKTRLENACQ